jgi:hypothetical protein
MQSKGNIDLILYVDSAVGDIDFIDDWITTHSGLHELGRPSSSTVYSMGLFTSVDKYQNMKTM